MRIKTKFIVNTTGITIGVWNLLYNVPEKMFPVIKELHRELKEEVRKNLLTTSTRDPKATDPGTGASTKMIAKNITNYYHRTKNRIFFGTGNLSLLDKADPFVVNNIFATRILRNDNIRLWRLLEYGTTAKNYLIRPRLKMRLSFFWKRLGDDVILGRVRHPGQTGREYFSLAIGKSGYSFFSKYNQRVMQVLTEQLHKYSY